MSRIPEPDRTPDGPAYEGRLLARADEEVVDQGAGFDLRTLLSRRAMLAYIGAGVGSVALAACASGATGSTASGSSSAAATTSTGEIPDETAGPYPGDGSNGADVLERSGIVRSDIRSSLDGGATAAGVQMALTLTILDTANGDVPFTGAAVYVWHCDAAGGYSLYSDGITEETYLRGVQVVGDDGTVTFSSIFPACYTGRWPHIHFEVYPSVDDITDSTKAIATSQVAVPQDACTTVYALSEYAGSSANLAQVTLDSDNVFGDDGGALQLATVTGDATAGYSVALTARVDTATTPTAGTAPSGGGGGAGGGAGGTPPTGAPPTGGTPPTTGTEG
ncbi:protocatechuate 3,4-dioxygenase beta subunit [Clavibacter michiganensis]|uniref:dioxygenase family protein n=1 Tax=Clavibacter michiganensis TaxID=28447 RepID=UPI001AEA5039|nr:3,4-dioxygenase subunit beta [Clavibacter michiganensis]MBP2457431.1 protocatechuate 3,4-dioxygenase beta subunit [Clavibacter michiganensis]MDQ0410001.1 protocatechuate 3,4-dioxygenase beta subunit [Clavibacter michiganensis]